MAIPSLFPAVTNSQIAQRPPDARQFNWRGPAATCHTRTSYPDDLTAAAPVAIACSLQTSVSLQASLPNPVTSLPEPRPGTRQTPGKISGCLQRPMSDGDC